MAGKKTVIVTGASQGIGAAVVQAFLDRGYNVVATVAQRFQGRLRGLTEPRTRRWRHRQAATAEKVAQTAIGKFGSIDHVVNNAGIFSAKALHGLHRRRLSRSRLAPIWKGSSSSPSSQSSRCCRKAPAAA